MMTSKGTWQECYLERFYRQRKNWIDGTKQFYELIQNHVPADKQILEIGPGPENRTSAFLGSHFASLDGLDVNEEAKQNPALRHIHIYDGGKWPIADGSYDAIAANYVIEHLEDPQKTMAEAYRVLHPGGLFIFRTPNLWHYVSMASYLSPHWFHKLVVNRLRNEPADSHEPWPTYYRMNSPHKIRKLMCGAGFREVELAMIEKDPSYGMASRMLFIFFMGYERLVNSSNLLSMFRVNILGVFEKPG
jgi:SAM-dependent methyltransferase